MNFKILSLLIILISSISSLSAKENTNIIDLDSESATNIDFDKLKSQTAMIVMPKVFLESTYKNTAQGRLIPKILNDKFDKDVRLLTHNVLFKIPKDYESFVKTVLKNKSTIQENLLYNSQVTMSNDTIYPCSTLSGSIISDMKLPKIVTMFDVPEKLLCDISITNQGVGKKYLRPELLAQLPKTLKDEDVHFLNFNLSKCNMIFRHVSQNAFFIKTPDGKTLAVFDNYSLVKQETIDKLNKMPFINPLDIINKQSKENFIGVLKYINSSINN